MPDFIVAAGPLGVAKVALQLVLVVAVLGLMAFVLWRAVRPLLGLSPAERAEIRRDLGPHMKWPLRVLVGAGVLLVALSLLSLSGRLPTGLP